MFGRTRAVGDLRPIDFGKFRAMVAKRLGPFALSKFVQMVRTIFAFGASSEILPVQVRFGDQFSKPPKRILRLERKKVAARLIEPEDAWKLMEAAGTQLRAMIYLGLNCGYGQKDCADLQRDALTTRPGWLSVARQKTGIDRRCSLWPETVAALEAVRANRPAPLDPADADCVFLTAFGRRWVRFEDHGDERRGVRTDAVGLAFRKAAKAAGVKVPGGLYVLRHTFRTVADETHDQAAIDLIMGHADDSMADAYRERIADDRLEAVVNHIRAWLIRGSMTPGGGVG
jgi:integrase